MTEPTRSVCMIPTRRFHGRRRSGEFHALRGGHGLIGEPTLWHPLVAPFLDRLAAR